MVDADQLRVVFSVNGVGFVMPVANLLAIRGKDEDALVVAEQTDSPFQTGFMVYRDTDVAVYSLAALFKLPETGSDFDSKLLVFSGADTAWAVKVDHVDGVLDSAQFKCQDVPGYLFRDSGAPYHQVAMHSGQLLISVGVEELERNWRRGE